jgi:hypothetical protein
MPRLDEAAREKNRKFIERLLAEGWNQEGEFIVHPTNRDIRVLWRPGSGELFFSPKYGEALKSETLDLKGNADPRIFELKSVRIIEEGLRAILLPNVIRPALGPHIQQQRNSYPGPSPTTCILRSPMSGPYWPDFWHWWR